MIEFDKILLFGKKSLGDLFKDIYTNQKTTEKQIGDMILALKPFISNASEAAMIVPLIQEYLEVKVKNDEHLIKMAAVVQRAMSSAPKDGGDSYLSELEMQSLLDTVNDMENKQTKILEEANSIKQISK